MSQGVLERALQSKLVELENKFALITKAYNSKCQLLLQKDALIQ